MAYYNIPLCWPFKMIPNGNTQVVHFDDGWHFEQRKSYERDVRYFQKWKKSDTTPLQIEASSYPGDLKVYDKEMQVVKSFIWTEVIDAGTYKIYETTFDVSDLPNGIYFLYIAAGSENLLGGFLSEPINVHTTWKNTMKFVYRNSTNKEGVAWSTGIQMVFRCEAGISMFTPDRERNSYANQTYDVKTLKGIPLRMFKLLIGEAPGVAPYVIDILNRIFCCDYVLIEGKQYETALSSKWEVTQVKGYPLVGAAIDVVEAKTKNVLQIGSDIPIGGFVTAYNFETGFFGNGTTIPILETENS